jgi:hypothetical protein
LPFVHAHRPDALPTSYIKALEAIKTFRKDQTQLVRELTIELQYLTQLKEKAGQVSELASPWAHTLQVVCSYVEQLRKTHGDTLRKIAEADTSIQALAEQLQPIEVGEGCYCLGPLCCDIGPSIHPFLNVARLSWRRCAASGPNSPSCKQI